MKLPKRILNKITKIVNCEREKNRLMQDINEWNPNLNEPVHALSEGWDWQMYFRSSIREINSKEIEAVILTALTGKIHKVDYGKQKTITISELMKQKSIMRIF